MSNAAFDLLLSLVVGFVVGGEEGLMGRDVVFCLLFCSV